jgi:hypothetical protein
MRFLPLLALLIAFMPAVRADETALGNGDRATIRAVVAAQLDAFQHDDESAAFGFASPAIQQQFQSADNFMRMVRSSYQPVYRPRDVQFGAIVTRDGDIVQLVELIGPDGTPALAHYVMQRQPDGAWRINGCYLTASEQRTT